MFIYYRAGKSVAVKDMKIFLREYVRTFLSKDIAETFLVKAKREKNELREEEDRQEEAYIKEVVNQSLTAK